MRGLREQKTKAPPWKEREVKLGIVTYNIAANWDLPTTISVCEEIGLSGVELRTTHAHGVEVVMGPQERQKVRATFSDSNVELAGLGSAFDYHSPDQDELNANIEGTKAYMQLASDVGSPGVKVRPNGLPEGVPEEKTLEQIGLALRTVGEFGENLGVQVRLEVHGRETSEPSRIARILDVADHANVVACWNSNSADMAADGTIADNFRLIESRIGLVHINRLHSGYPYSELFSLLRQAGYSGLCLAEIPGCPDLDSAKELLRYYKALWELLV